ncbi:hypothetical protein [Mammaliicoccus sciuri]|uniref:hypothetical protein n=1 Tax=Mammaliicoccus sciuri TaxID=1296 RepID=UPI002B2611CB|nr:hypothetical protein [Mammaliicoccus sciuri]WQL61691.1 hypothetical protein P3T96_15030 [Mammaliicoccus sciuri]
MENQTTQEIKHLTDRISDVNKRINTIDGRVEKLDDKVDNIEEKFNDRHTEMVRITTESIAENKASRESINGLVKSLDNLVDEMKETNSVNSKRFERVEDKITKVENAVNDKTLSITTNLEEKKMSKSLIGTIVVAILGLVGVLAKVIAPLIVG